MFAGKLFPPNLECEAALLWCYDIVAITVAVDGKTLAPHARGHLFAHYRPRFLNAIVVYNRHFLQDIRDLSVRSVLLAQTAVNYAGNSPVISIKVLDKAIQAVSCPPEKIFLHWCPSVLA